MDKFQTPAEKQILLKTTFKIMNLYMSNEGLEIMLLFSFCYIVCYKILLHCVLPSIVNINITVNKQIIFMQLLH